MIIDNFEIRVAQMFDYVNHDMLNPFPYLNEDAPYVDTGDWAQLRVWTKPFDVGVLLVKPVHLSQNWWWDDLNQHEPDDIAAALYDAISEATGRTGFTIDMWSPDVALHKDGGHCS